MPLPNEGKLEFYKRQHAALRQAGVFDQMEDLFKAHGIGNRAEILQHIDHHFDDCDHIAFLALQHELTEAGRAEFKATSNASRDTTAPGEEHSED